MILIDYQHTFYESHEDQGYVEDVESISNETYRRQLPDIPMEIHLTGM